MTRPFRLPSLAVALLLLVTAVVGRPLAAQDEQPAEATAEASAAHDAWTTDAAAALERAAAENKDLLVNFTGSDWCVWCIRLEKEVFGETAFAETAPDSFVLVTLDFPRDKTNQSEELQAQNAQWQEKLEVSSFPSVYLLDSQGRPYAKTGYQEGGPEPYLTHLGELRAVREQRDALLAQAAESSGEAKAKLLDEALSLMDESLVTTHYEPLIKEIVALDAEDQAGLRTKYFAAQDAEARRQIMSRIALAARTLPAPQALETIDASIAEMKLPPMMRIEALQTKLKLLRDSGQLAAVESLLDEMIAIEGVDPRVHQRLVVQKLYNMVGAGQSDEALELADQLISSTIENLYLCVAKGELLDRLGRHEEALQAYDVALRAAISDPETRVQIALSKSEALAELDRFDEAIDALSELAADERMSAELRIEVLLQKAILLRESDRAKEAEATENQALELAPSDDERESLHALIEQLRKGF